MAAWQHGVLHEIFSNFSALGEKYSATFYIGRPMFFVFKRLDSEQEPHPDRERIAP